AEVTDVLDAKVMIYEFYNKKPAFDYNVFIAPSADLIGDVTVGEKSSIWFNATLRGDVNWIEIGQRSNIQDNSCVHVMNRTGPTRIGSDVTVGHSAMIHGCTIKDRVLVGIHATVLDKAVVESDVILAAGSLVPPGKILESGYLYMGSPVKQVRKLSGDEIDSIKRHADNYVRYARAHMHFDKSDRNPFYEREEE
ncbi:MAG: gamma carbonic anhydrase family protein, partial [Balneolaceae bacterium]